MYTNCKHKFDSQSQNQCVLRKQPQLKLPFPPRVQYRSDGQRTVCMFYHVGVCQLGGPEQSRSDDCPEAVQVARVSKGREAQ